MDKIKELPNFVSNGEVKAGLTISYKWQINKWVFSYGRMTHKSILYEDNVTRVGIGDSLEDAYEDFMSKLKNHAKLPQYK